MATKRGRRPRAWARISAKRKAKTARAAIPATAPALPPPPPPPPPAPAPAPASFRRTAQDRALQALDSLVELATGAKSEAVRVSAANAVIDRAFGRPAPGSRAGPDDEDEGGPLEVQWLERS